MVVVVPRHIDIYLSTHPRRLETNPFTSLTDSKLDWSTNDTALGCSLGFTLADEKAAFGTKPVAALVAVEAPLVPLASNGGQDNLIHDMLFAAQAAGCGAPRVAMEAPCEAVLFNKGGLRIERLQEC
jgi:hypothetical protein